MKKLRIPATAWVGLCLALTSISENSPLVFEIGVGSTVAVRGSSNVSGFTCRLTGIVAQGAIRASVHENPAWVAFSGAPMEEEVSSIDCGNALMNKYLRTTLNENQFPTIRFHLQVLKFTPGASPLTFLQVPQVLIFAQPYFWISSRFLVSVQKTPN